MHLLKHFRQNVCKENECMRENIYLIPQYCGPYTSNLMFINSFTSTKKKKKKKNSEHGKVHMQCKL